MFLTLLEPVSESFNFLRELTCYFLLEFFAQIVDITFYHVFFTWYAYNPFKEFQIFFQK